MSHGKSIQKQQAFHEDLSRTSEIRLSSDRTFGFALGTFLALVGIWPVIHHGRVRWWALAPGCACYVAALVFPASLHAVNKAAARFSGLLHRVVSPVIMWLFFFVIITPFALLFRLGGKDLLRLRFDKSAGTYWVPRQPPGPAAESMVNQF